jgi:hypothetical protein
MVKRLINVDTIKVLVKVQKKLCSHEPRKRPEREKSPKSKQKVKSIAVHQHTYLELKEIQKTLAKETHHKTSLNDILQTLLLKTKELDALKTVLLQKDQEYITEIKKDREFLKDLLMKSMASNQPPQIVFPYSQMQNTSFGGVSAGPPPPPPARFLPKKPYRAPNTGNIRNDYVKEIKQIFTGTPLKPSSILSTTLPKHAESDIHEICDDFEIPMIDLISTAKKFSKSQELSILV